MRCSRLSHHDWTLNKLENFRIVDNVYVVEVKIDRRWRSEINRIEVCCVFLGNCVIRIESFAWLEDIGKYNWLEFWSTLVNLNSHRQFSSFIADITQSFIKYSREVNFDAVIKVSGICGHSLKSYNWIFSSSFHQFYSIAVFVTVWKILISKFQWFFSLLFLFRI